MTADLVSLAVIALVAAACPIAARLIPGKLVPETVFLLIAGALLGPHMVGAIGLTDSVGLLSDLGLAFLFLLAGYEINPKSLTGSQGKRGLLTWVVSIVLAFIAVRLSPDFSVSPIDGIAEWKTVLILLGFVAVAVLVAVVPSKAKKAGHRLFRFLTENADTTSQTMMRVTVLLLVGLVALSAVFALDIVLGAFAAGFVLRYIIPEGDDSLEKKLDGVAYGFLIPIFFIVSGAKIDLLAVFQQPVLLVGFILMLLLIRAVPIFVALSSGKETRDMSTHNRLTVSLYCTTALPIIVAVTSVAVSAGAMPQETASVLVAAGAVTVFLMPLLASLTYRVADAQPIEAMREIAQNPRDIGSILREHWELERMLARQEAAARIAARRNRRDGTDAAWQDAAFGLQRTSARKRAIDEALDVAAQEIAAKKAAGDQLIGEHVSPAIEHHAAHREERRRRIAERAVREYHRRMAEMGRAAERMGISQEEARRMFQEAVRPKPSDSDETSGEAGHPGSEENRR